MASRRSALLLTFLGTLPLASGCGSTSPSASEDERIPVGDGNPAAGHCVRLGYQVGSGADAGYCLFPDGSKCKDWEFFRGQCGQPFSYCQRQGGTLSNAEATKGTVTLSYSVCRMPDGRQCTDDDFAKTNRCNGLP